MAEHWRNRITGSGEEAPDQLLANPKNFRIHPKNQQDALSGALGELGWIQQVVVNQQTGHVIDGHLRVSLAISKREASVPVLYVDLSPEEEALALLTLDPIASMAAADKEQLDALLREVQTGDAGLMAMLEQLAAKEGLIPPNDPNAEWQGMPEFEQEDLSAKKSLIVNFASLEDMAAFADLIGQPLTEKTQSVWYPPAAIGHYADKRYADEP